MDEKPKISSSGQEENRMRTNELILYKNMEDGQILEDMTFLMENYEVDSETAKRDAEQLIKNWLEAGIIK